MEKTKRGRVRVGPLSFLESSNCIRLLGALEQRVTRILGTLVRLSFPRQRAEP
jgi:hypothetical protein